MTKRAVKKAKKPANPSADKVYGKVTGCGYTPVEGGFKLPPVMAGPQTTMALRRKSLNDLLTMTNRFVADELERLSKENQEWWKKIGDDLGLDLKEPWASDANAGTVTRRKDKPHD